MKNNTTKNVWLLLGLVALLLSAACGTTPDTVDKDPALEAQKDDIATVLGVDRGALDAFDEASKELEKPRPDLAKAKSLLESALAKSPDFLEAQYNLGVVNERLGAFDEAIAAYQKAQKQDRLNVHSVRALTAIGRAQALAGKTEEAIKTFEEAGRIEPENIDILNSLAAIYLKTKKNEEALDFVKKVLREDNQNVTALNTLAQVYTAQDNRSMAVYVFKKAARAALDANKTDEQRQTEPALLVMADKVKVKDGKETISADILNNLGLMYMKMGEMPLAVFNFNAAAKLDPSHVESRLNTGAIYLQYLNYEDAKGLFADALKAADGNCTAQLGLAASNFALGATADAKKGYQGFLTSCDEKSAAAHAKLEQLYEKEQDFDSAIKHCLEYVKVAEKVEGDPLNAEYCKALENMKNMARDAPMLPPAEGEGEGGEMPPEGEGGELPPEGDGGEMPPEEGAGEPAPQ